MLEVLRSRRSVRNFQDRHIEPEKIRMLTEALVRSPSSRSINPWEFILVDNSNTIDELSRCKPHGAGFLSGVPLAVVILGDISRSDTCIEDCSIAAITLQYTAESLDLGSCWCQIRLRESAEGISAEEYVRRILGVPGHYLVESVIGVGYPGEEKDGHTRESLDWGKVYCNKYKGDMVQ